VLDDDVHHINRNLLGAFLQARVDRLVEASNLYARPSLRRSWASVSRSSCAS
jgi:hypothetical protein